ncbi:MAG: GntR family transcriptional regulator [Oscillospiraceae bacterium]|nr:GntR family transcriptional regulator [Oscillospiraceae bacterium]
MRKNTDCEYVKRQIVDIIKSGELKPGDKMYSGRAVASMLGCSPNTAEKALSQLEQSGYIIRTERKSSYVSGNISIYPKNNCIVAVFIVYIDIPLWSSVLQVLESCFAEYGFYMLAVGHDNTVEKLIERLNNINKSKVDGVIITPFFCESRLEKEFSKAINRLLSENIPVVFMDRTVDGLDVPCVSSNNIMASMKLCDYLIKNGHKKIAVLRNSSVSAVIDRRDGFYMAAAQNRVKSDVEIYDLYINSIDEHIKNEHQKLFSEKLMERFEEIKPTALFTINAQLASLAVSSLENAGYRIPDDVSLVTFDAECAKIKGRLKITGINQDFCKMSVLAAAMIADRIFTGISGCTEELSRQTVEASFYEGNSVAPLKNF